MLTARVLDILPIGGGNGAHLITMPTGHALGSC